MLFKKIFTIVLLQAKTRCCFAKKKKKYICFVAKICVCENYHVCCLNVFKLIHLFKSLISVFLSANQPFIINLEILFSYFKLWETLYLLQVFIRVCLGIRFSLMKVCVVCKIMGRKGIKSNIIQKDRKKSASEMTEGRKNKNIKKQQRRGNSYAVEGHAVLNTEYLHIDGSVCQPLSVLKINVLFFPLCSPCPVISQLLSFLSFFLFVLEFNSLS